MGGWGPPGLVGGRQLSAEVGALSLDDRTTRAPVHPRHLRVFWQAQSLAATDKRSGDAWQSTSQLRTAPQQWAGHPGPASTAPAGTECVKPPYDGIGLQPGPIRAGVRGRLPAHDAQA